jgi:hypothetical protein
LHSFKLIPWKLRVCFDDEPENTRGDEIYVRDVEQRLMTRSQPVTEASSTRRAEHAKGGKNAEALHNIKSTLAQQAMVWSLLPAGRVMPARAVNAVHELLRARKEAGDDGYAYLRDVESLSLTDDEVAHGEHGRPDAEVVCGRVSQQEAQKLDAPFAARSVLLKPAIPPDVVAAAEATVSPELTPRSDDTVESLLTRIGNDPDLDWINVCKDPQNFPNHVREGLANLNTAPTSCQPKRRSESVIVEDRHRYRGTDGEGYGRWIYRLFN